MPTRISCNFFAILIVLSATALSAVQLPKLSDMRKYFEWGEYDTLLQVLEPYLRNPESSDSAFLSECHKYLGVAYFARSRIGDARSEFGTAYLYNKEVTLDSFYVSREIMDLFNDAIVESRSRVQRDAEKDSVLKVKELQIDQKDQALQKVSQDTKKRGNIGLGISCYATAALCFGISWNAFNDAERKYDNYKRASAIGDAATVNSLKGDIQRNDNVHVVTLISGALFTIPGTYFLGKALRRHISLAVVPGLLFEEHSLYAAQVVLDF